MSQTQATPMVESADVADTGVHLPAASGTAPVDSMSLLGSLMSLPPRAQKRRRGSRFKADDEEERKGSSSVAAAAASSAPASPSHADKVDRPWRERKFEYLDHTADIQLHSWGDTLAEALEQVVLAMFSYVTDLTRVAIDPSRTETFTVKGHDMDSLLFNLLDEFLYRFATDEWIVRDVSVERLDLSSFSATVRGYGEAFTLQKHTQGTEIKAITYSNMQIFVRGKRVTSDNDQTRAAGAQRRPSITETSVAQTEAAKAAAAGRVSVASLEPFPGEEVAPPAEAQASGAVILDDLDETPLSEEQIKQRGAHGADIYVIVDI